MKTPWYIKTDGNTFRLHWLVRYALAITFMAGWIWGTIAFAIVRTITQ